MSDPSVTDRDRIEKLADSFLTSYRAGQRPSIDAYVEQYPDLADQLRDLITALVVLERNAPQRNRFGDRQGLAHTTPPREIGEFSIIREIGRGGMGVVYEAVQQSLGRHVALKVLSTAGLLSPTHLERFRLEARSAGRLHHSHIVPVFGVGEQDGAHYYAMQFIAGQSLDQVIDALRQVRLGSGKANAAASAVDEPAESAATEMLSGDYSGDHPAEDCVAATNKKPGDKLPQAAGDISLGAKHSITGQFSSGSSGRPFYESVARVGLQVAEALAYAHGEGILHRDIKPSNLLVDRNSNTWITDFGLVKAEDAQPLTETGDFVGTLRYMAPERLDGWSDRRSDIYGLGATLYELLTQRTFLKADNRGQLIDHIRHKQPDAPTKIDAAIPRDLETIVLKASSKEPGSRYHTADEMAEDLRRFLADRPILSRRSTRGEQFVRWCRRNPQVAALSAIAAAALVAGMIGSTWQAIRATRAERLAEDRLTREQIVRRVADAARKAEAEQRRLAEQERRVAETQRAEAEKQRTTAESNYQRSRAAVDRYFTLTSESTLFDVPGLEPLRKELLEGALEFYATVALERDSDPAALVDLASANLKMATIYLALNRADDTLSSVRKALDLIDRLHREHGQRDDLERSLGGFWHGERWIQRSMDQPRDSLGMMITVMRMEKMWSRFVERFPDTPAFSADLAYLRHMISGFMIGSGQVESGMKWYRKASDISEALIREYPDVAQYRADQSMGGLSTVAALTRAGRTEDLLPLTRRSVELAEGLAVGFPAVPAYRANLINGLSTLGRLTAASDPAQAMQLLNRARDLADSLLREFPEHLAVLQVWTSVYGNWFGVASEHSHNNDAEANVRYMIDVANKLVQSHPHSSKLRGQLANALLTTATNLEKQERSPTNTADLKQWQQETLASVARDFPDDAENWNRMLGMAITEATEFLAGLRGDLTGYDGRVKQLEAQLEARPADLSTRLQLAGLLQVWAEQRMFWVSDSSAARPAAKRALELLTPMANEHPSVPILLEYVGWNQRTLGEAARREHHYDTAAALFFQASSAFSTLASNKAIPDRLGWYRDWEAQLMMTAASAQYEAGQKNEALDTLRKADKSFRTLNADYSGNPEYRMRHAACLGLLAEWLVSAGELRESEVVGLECEQGWETLSTTLPKDRGRLNAIADYIANLIDGSLPRSTRRARLISAFNQVMAVIELEVRRPKLEAWLVECFGHKCRIIATPLLIEGRNDEARTYLENAVYAFDRLSSADIPQRDGMYGHFYADSLVFLSVAQRRLGQSDEALAGIRRATTRYEELLRKYPNNATLTGGMLNANQNLAQVLADAGQWDEAEDILRRLIAADPGQFRPYLSLADVLGKANKVAEAKDALRSACDLVPSDVSNLNELAWFLVTCEPAELRDPASGLELASKAVELVPHDAGNLNTLGTAQYRACQWQPAIESLTKAEELAPNRSLGFNGFFLAMAHWQLAHQDEARSWYDRSVEWTEKNRPRDQELIRFRAEAEALLGIAASAADPSAVPNANH